MKAIRGGGRGPAASGCIFRWPAAVLASLCLALAGCGDGDSSDLHVVVKVNGQQVAGPFGIGAEQAVTVTSGDEVIVETEAGATFSLEQSQVEATEASSDDTSYQFIPMSMSGGAATIKVASQADATDRLSVILTVQSHRFTSRTWTVGEIVIDETTYSFDGSSRRYEHLVESVTDKGYTLLTGANTDSTVRDTYDPDGNHTYHRADWWTGDYWDAEWCKETPGAMIRSFPLFVGKQWDTEWEYECVFEPTIRYGAHNSVVGVETLTVPAGTFQALHIVSELTFYGYVGGDPAQEPIGQTDCWWSVDFKQDVRCVHTSADGAEQYRVEAVQLAGQTEAARAAGWQRPAATPVKPGYRPS
jgi:hypothetical protein